MFLVMRPTFRPNNNNNNNNNNNKSICKAQNLVHRDHTHNNLSMVKERFLYEIGRYRLSHRKQSSLQK